MKSKRGPVLAAAISIIAAVAPSAAFADGEGEGYYEVNYGDGTCATVSCGRNGCVVVDIHPCPKEVGDG